MKKTVWFIVAFLMIVLVACYVTFALRNTPENEQSQAAMGNNPGNGLRLDAHMIEHYTDDLPGLLEKNSSGC